MSDITRMLDALDFAHSFFDARAQMATPGSEGAGKLYECAKGCADAMEMLKAQEPVVHGRWLGWHHHWAWLVCDQCNEKMLVRKSNHGYIQEFPHNFCPNCGAKMDGESDG